MGEKHIHFSRQVNRKIRYSHVYRKTPLSKGGESGVSVTPDSDGLSGLPSDNRERAVVRGDFPAYRGSISGSDEGETGRIP